jgi:hypothetical protein
MQPLRCRARMRVCRCLAALLEVPPVQSQRGGDSVARGEPAARGCDKRRLCGAVPSAHTLLVPAAGPCDHLLPHRQPSHFAATLRARAPARAPVVMSCMCADREIWRRCGKLVSCADIYSLLLPFALARWYPTIMLWLALLRARSQWVEATLKNLPSRGSEMQLQLRLGQAASKCPPCPCSFPARPPCFSEVLPRHWTQVLAVQHCMQQQTHDARAAACAFKAT